MEFWSKFYKIHIIHITYRYTKKKKKTLEEFPQKCSRLNNHSTRQENAKLNKKEQNQFFFSTQSLHTWTGFLHFDNHVAGKIFITRLHSKNAIQHYLRGGRKKSPMKCTANDIPMHQRNADYMESRGMIQRNSLRFDDEMKMYFRVCVPAISPRTTSPPELGLYTYVDLMIICSNPFATMYPNLEWIRNFPVFLHFSQSRLEFTSSRENIVFIYKHFVTYTILNCLYSKSSKCLRIFS